MTNRSPSERTDAGLSRRDFLRGSAASALAGGLLSGTLAAAPGAALANVDTTAAAAGPQILGPGPVPMRFSINGKPLEAQLEPRVTLLDALRNHLDLTGAKKVCDRATCGACTVLLDGRPVYACTVLAVEAQGSEIQTVEGLAQGGTLHPLQAAFVEHDATQCGFCTPGFVMACKAFLDANPGAVSAEDVRRGLGGNLCRCGTYAGIQSAVLAVAQARGGAGNG